MNFEFIKVFADILSHAIELFALVVIALTVVFIVILIFSIFFSGRTVDEKLKSKVVKGIQLSLDLLIIADIVDSVLIDLTIQNVLTLGALVIVRVILSWSICIEVEGVLPWKKNTKQT